MIQHVVLAKWKKSASETQKKQAADLLAALRSKIPGITGYTAGAQCSNEGLHKGYEYGFVMSFTDVAARDAYLPHPEHKKVVEVLLPLVDDVLVFDYSA